MLKLWNVFSDLVAFQSIFWTLLSVFFVPLLVKRYNDPVYQITKQKVHWESGAYLTKLKE